MNRYLTSSIRSISSVPCSVLEADELRLDTLRVLDDPQRVKILREGAANTAALFSFQEFSDKLSELLKKVL